MLDNKKIGVIGTGNMGRALIGGLINSGSSVSENIVCSDIKEGKLKKIEEEFGVVTRDNNSGVARESEIIIYAVKPQIMAPVLKETGDCLDMSKIVISIAAGVPLAAIESCLGKELRVIRVMPNVPALIMEGASAVAAGKNALPEDLTLAKAIFDSVGKSVIIEEELMDAVTGLSGSGPAYIFLIIDALSDAGVKVGLAREDALFLSAQTVLGAAKLLIDTDEHPGKLKDSVTSPGGTAIAGLHTLEGGGLRTTLINAVEAATTRSKELGEIMIRKFS
ncbi:MAG: pyrroline-5-carboxylate reductase [Desulfobacteraceae bacterium]|nr:pyrroline-5-carboxylate reductase [Desulfobacteraceae bacterium]